MLVVAVRFIVLLGLVACEAPDQVHASSGATLTFKTPEGAFPIDPKQAWHYNRIKLVQAWLAGGQGSNTLVAVIDSGKWSHPDLDTRWVGGFNTLCKHPTGDDFGDYRHGVHVAGTIAGREILSTPIPGVREARMGVCPGCTLMPVNISTPIPQGSEGSHACPANPSLERINRYVTAIRYAAGLPISTVSPTGEKISYSAPSPAKVINISSAPTIEPPEALCPQALQDAVDDAVAQGSTIVVSAGNVSSFGDDARWFRWPNCRNVIVVAAASNEGDIEPYSARGPGITLAAPGGAAGPFGPNDPERGHGYGELLGCTGATPTGGGDRGVVSTWSAPRPGGEVRCHRGWSGTSMAAPHVAGVVGLMVSRNPNLVPAQIREILTRTATPIGCAPQQCGAGMLDAEAAVLAARTAAFLDVALVDFGTTPRDIPVERNALLVNTGVARLDVSRMTISGGQGQIQFASLGCSGVSCEVGFQVDPSPTPRPIALRCTPTSSPTVEATLHIHSNALGQPVTSVTLSCARPLSVAQVEPAALDFGGQWFGTSMLYISPLTLRNTGAPDSSLHFTVRPALAGEITLSCATSSCTCTHDAQGPRCDGTVAVGASVTLDVGFRGAALGVRTGQLNVFSDDQPSPVGVMWEGATVGGLRVLTDLDFDTCDVDHSNVCTLVLHNDSGETLELSPTIQGDAVFTIRAVPPAQMLPTQIPPGSSVSWNLRLVADWLDNFGAGLVIHHNGPGGGFMGSNVPSVFMHGTGI